MIFGVGRMFADTEDHEGATTVKQISVIINESSIYGNESIEGIDILASNESISRLTENALATYGYDATVWVDPRAGDNNPDQIVGDVRDEDEDEIDLIREVIGAVWAEFEWPVNA